jgi:anti-anti-sigma regulatory factor
MLKITLHDRAGELRLKLEGRLSGPWVNELEQCWKTASSTTQGRKTVLDLGEVDFVDPAGESLLAHMSSAISGMVSDGA